MSVLALISPAGPAHLLPMLLYIGPDVFLPLTSALAAILGVLLLFWQKVTALAGRLWRMIRR
jgi:hypothetical protein